eukprot:gb/GEZN01002024.1/.p1 GENE.gb/GEZN01002024.1/~~gb/GEZN01002024.1/.p1  ORF type:complete len:844 (-),score=91.59 gb/GEZN01002024.1/:154-2535(-)
MVCAFLLYFGRSLPSYVRFVDHYTDIYQAGMAACFAGVVCESWSIVATSDSRHYQVSVAGIATFSLAFLFKVFMWGGVVLDIAGREVPIFHYLEWTHTLPLMKMLLSVHANERTPWALILCDIGMCLCGLTADCFASTNLPVSIFLFLTGVSLYLLGLRIMSNCSYVDNRLTKFYGVLGCSFPVICMCRMMGWLNFRLIEWLLLTSDIVAKLGWTSFIKYHIYDNLYSAAVRSAQIQREANRKLVEINEHRRRLMSYIFHEVRIPVSSLVLATDALSELVPELDGKDGLKMKDAEETLLLMKDSFAGLSKVLDDVLTFEKVDQDKLVLEEVAFNVEKLMQSIIKTFEPKCKEKRLSLVANTSKDVPIFLADKYRIRQILFNFVSNAIKFSSNEGVIKIRAKLDVREGKETRKVSGVVQQELDSKDRVWLRLSVQDSGIGLTPEQQVKMFEPYSQFDPGKNQEGGGTGLGLSICKKLADLQNGFISVISTYGSGATFVVTLPLKVNNAQVSSDTEGSDDDRSRVIPGNIHYSPMRHAFKRKKKKKAIKRGEGPLLRVLVVDDNSTTRKLLCRVLQRAGFLACDAGGGEECLKKTASIKQDIVVLDQEMPGMKGPETAARLRASGYAGLIIGVSGNHMPEKQKEMLDAGVDVTFLKPLQIQNFLRFVAAKTQSPCISPDQPPRRKLVERAPFSLSPTAPSSFSTSDDVIVSPPNTPPISATSADMMSPPNLPLDLLALPENLFLRDRSHGEDSDDPEESDTSLGDFYGSTDEQEGSGLRERKNNKDVSSYSAEVS